MTIRKRLILSYIAMVLIPVVLFFGIAALLASLFFGELTGTGDPSSRPPHHPMSSVWESFDNREQLLAGVTFLARYDPDRLTDTGFLHETEDAFNRLQAGLVVAKNDRVMYASPLVDTPDLHDRLKKVGPDHRRGWSSRVDGRFVERYEFTFSDQSKGVLYFLYDMHPFSNGIWRFALLMLLSLLLVIGLTNGVLTYLVSRSIIRPLFILKRAAEQIKEGNLDQPVSLRRKDEIGEVGEAFEEMRVRLKQSILLQMQYEENRKELISNISHDLKTPITGIKACVEGIREGIADTEEKRHKYMKMIENKATDMDHLIDELFLFSKLDLKRLPFHYDKMDLSAYLRDCVHELQAEPRMKDVAMDLEGVDRPVLVMGDHEKLQRVILNIVDNSMKYMNRENKAIHIKLTAEGEEAVIRIRDNGAGIDPEALPHIFDRFYRAEPSRSSQTGGSGLGLAIVKHIVEEHGGRTWAESEVGAGTTIAFTLPMQPMLKSGGERA